MSEPLSECPRASLRGTGPKNCQACDWTAEYEEPFAGLTLALEREAEGRCPRCGAFPGPTHVCPTRSNDLGWSVSKA